MDLQATVEKRMHVVCLPLVLDELSEDLKELGDLFSNGSDNVCVVAYLLVRALLAWLEVECRKGHDLELDATRAERLHVSKDVIWATSLDQILQLALNFVPFHRLPASFFDL